MDGKPMDGVGKIVPWAPTAGKHFLIIMDKEEEIIDSVHFEVRGPLEDGESLLID
jgi:hypothetical protein